MRSIINIFAMLFGAILLHTASPAICAQSTDQNFPTPVTTSEIRGTIRARDIGDSRATTYFYAFNGEQGDIFINVQTRNFDGDIDVFMVDGLMPLTKIVLYADAGTTETGRIVYLRKGERMLLRIEGRSPDDNPATFSIKFAGSFIALKASRRTDEPDTMQAVSGDGVRRNSAGAIIPVTETKKTVTGPETPSKKDVAVTERNSRPGKKDVPTVFNPRVSPKAPTLKADPGPKDAAPAGTSRRPTKPKDTNGRTGSTVVNDVPDKRTTETAANRDPLASIRLVIVLKNGKRIEKPMTDVLKSSLDRAGYTLVFKDGNIVRYQIANVASVSIE